MYSDDTGIRLSATDLAKHLGCRHLTQLDRAVAEGRLARPSGYDPALALLQQRGRAHEEAYVEHLRQQGHGITLLRDVEGEEAVERTIRAMRDGPSVIVQAALGHGHWAGRADLLCRVDQPSDLGSWSYEVTDTKLAQDTRGGTILQLCLYSDLVAQIQGRLPERMHVVKPGADFPKDTFRLAEYRAYYQLVRGRLEKVVADPPDASTYPNPVPQCEWCDWWSECDRRRHDDDALCLIAGIQPLHVVELQRQGIRTLEEFATRSKPLKEKPSRGSADTFGRIHGQARIQLKGRKEGKPRYVLLPPADDRGFLRLPKPSPGDVFFDIEGDPFVDGGGLEYLLGFAFANRNGELEYRSLWALDRAEEKRAFEQFIDFVMRRWKKHPDLHVYHFAPYEPGAVKRLMLRHATRETQVDRLLRGGRFVDLYAITRQGLQASVERYSLKDLEAFLGFARAVELRAASAALRRVDCELEVGSAANIAAEDRGVVERYNRDDCLATAALRDWLEDRRKELKKAGHSVPRPPLKDGGASDNVAERAAEVQKVYDALITRLPEDRDTWGEEEKATWLLAHQLDYFRREDKCAWWEFFRLHELEHDDLLEERKAVTGLKFVKEVGGTDKCPIHRYSFPVQEVSIDVGGKLHEVGGDSVGEVAGIDQVKGCLDIKKSKKAAHLHPAAVLVNERVDPKALDASLLDLGRWVGGNGIDAPGSYRAARDLLLSKPPRQRRAQVGSLRRSKEDVIDAAVRLAANLDSSVLAIQGPPGAGKTHTGANMIVELVRMGKRVGVTAVSHKVIRNLLEKVLEAARKTGVGMELAHKVSSRADDEPDGIEEVTDSADAFEALADGKVVGGTAWLWAHKDAVESVDYLIVDEAGQMSLAHVLAAGRCTRNIVLLGDPQQLEQPQKGAHPEGAEVAALKHMLGGHDTIAADKGLFLGVTRRLHPRICDFTSELFYENRLKSFRGLERQAVEGKTPFAGSGLFYVPVSHEGNQNRSVEEVDAVERVVKALVRSGVRWRDRNGALHPLGEENILIVAPYNAQVAALGERLPKLRVGTVDKFQGQQAPVVIYSMATSSAEEAPRGMGFLYNPNRFNVATSRAQCACILVASPRLFEPECRTPEQMRWANALCRYRELAREVAVGQQA